MTSFSDKQRGCEFCDIALDLHSLHISHAQFFGLIPTLQRTGLPSCYRKTIAAFEGIDFYHDHTAPGRHHTCSQDHGFCGGELAKVLPLRRGSYVLR